MKRFVVGYVMLACVVGCGGSKDANPAVTSTMPTVSGATPTYAPASSAPATSPREGPTSPVEFDRASKVFEDFEAAVNEAQSQGGSAVLPQGMLGLVGPPASVETQQQLAKQRVDGWRLADPLPKLRSILPFTGERQGSTVSLQACVDGTGTPVVLNGKRIGKAEAYSYRAYFKPMNGRLKLFLLEHKQVAAC